MATNLSNKGYKINDPSWQSYASSLNAARNSSVTGITSRDQIINPYEILNIAAYKNTARGQARYQEDLNELLAIQAQQQAAYDEWYNSEQSQVDRQRAAGLNPDLLGVEAGMAADTQSPDASPLEGVPTNGEIFSQVASGVSAIVGNIASVAALPSQIGAARSALNLSKSQTTGQNLSNLLAAEGAMFGGISNMVSDAAVLAAQNGEKFDFNKYLSDTDFSDVFHTYAPPGSNIENGPYAAAFRRAKNAVQKHRAAAYSLGKVSTDSQTEFGRVMADPYADADVLVQIAYLEPIAKAMRQIDELSAQFNITKLNLQQTYVDGLDGDLAAQDFNQRLSASIAKGKYDVNYYENFKGDEIAALDLAIKKSQSIISGAAAAIKDNYTKMWQNKNLTYAQRMAAQYMVMDGISKKWSDWLVAYNAANGITAPPSDKSVYQTDFIGNGSNNEQIGENLYNLGESLFDIQ